jgi:gamma-glutamyltranspeptidase/glutathione hydrolase
MAQGYAIEQNQVQSIEANRPVLEQWESSKRVLLPHFNERNRNQWAAPYPGEIFRQPELHATLMKLVDAEREALADGKSREQAIMAAYDRFYRGDIAEDIVAASDAAGGLFTLEDLARWRVYVEEPVVTTYKGIEVYKLTHWVQGPVMLQMLNLLEGLDVKGMGYNSARYIHTLYQIMNLAFADRDFYYGDPYFPPAEPIEGLLSKDYARDRLDAIGWDRNNAFVPPGDPYPYQGETNPFADLLDRWRPRVQTRSQASLGPADGGMSQDEAFLAGTTSIQAADEEGWVVSITPSGGWIPAFIAGSTGIGLSQRMQSFDLDRNHNPFNVLEPGKRPRATLSPGLALRGGRPYLSFAVQGGDSQDQNLLQLFLNVVEFGMNVQQAVEAANFNSYQMHSSFGSRRTEPGRLVVREDTPAWVIRDLSQLGYSVETWAQTSGPINAIYFDQANGTLWGGASNFGDDYGIAW